MECQICGAPSHNEEKVHLCNDKYTLCGWCEFRVKQYIDGNITSSIINIYWGAGHVCWSSWNSLRDIFRKYEIKEILELGIGLSSELFVNEGINVIGFDVWKSHVDLYQRHLGLKSMAKFHLYEDKGKGKGLNVEELYPGRKWDFIFVDGPQERSREVKLAMKLSNRFIYLHDPNLGEQDFFPNEDWKPVGPTGTKLFEKVIK